MKKIVLLISMLFNLATYAQKDELKTLKKIYDKDVPSASDLEKYKEALSSLKNSATLEEDVVYFNFYTAMLPLAELASKGMKATVIDFQKVLSPTVIADYSKASSGVLDYEKKTGKKVFTDDILEEIATVKPIIRNAALDLNEKKKYKEACNLFYALYQLDKSDGSNLENAAILAVQSENYTDAIAYYEEILQSDYLLNGVVYLAVNKLTGKEEVMPSKATRSDFINKLKTHEKPRDEKNILKKPKYAKTLALLLDQTNQTEKAKIAYKNAKEIAPDDVELLSSEVSFYYKIKDIDTYTKLTQELVEKKPNDASLHFNLGYLLLKDDQAIVDEINNSLKDYKKYDALVAKRKATFKNALPHLEKAYELDPNLKDIKPILKLTYEVLEMKDKAAKFK